MSIEDKKRWDRKYKEKIIPNKIVKVVDEYSHLAKGKKALDIACGMGRNSKLLASRGFEVLAIDISPLALDSLKGIENITTKEVDLDTYKLEEDSYDLIVCTYFLDRSLFPQIYKALKKDGIFIYETFKEHKDSTKVPSNKNFLLKEGELKKIFSKGYNIIHQSEQWSRDFFNNRVLSEAIVVQKTI
jgi:SAM-dependent methyltransferase